MIYLKILTFLFLFTITKTQQNVFDNHHLIRNDNFIEAFRRQYAGNIWYYDWQIKHFERAYLDRVNNLEYQKNPLINEIIRVEEMLYPLTLLSSFTKNCIEKFRSSIPSTAWAKFTMEDNCINPAKSQASYLTQSMVSTNRTLADHYGKFFENEVISCNMKYNTSFPMNYTRCLGSAVTATNSFTFTSHQTFSSQLTSAKNKADIYIKTYQECIFSVLNSTLANISKATTNIDRCIRNRDDCMQCKDLFCNDIYRISSTFLDPANTTMFNPFYGRNDTGTCLILDIF
ncbi:uncharacterized protein LOC142221011 [Haematobia irritans]|uniref:Putative secreted protein n=1 Tax=Haematobia irritans TaxID=7368 RepID=A0A1L8EGQ4_HAEIR